MANGLGKESTRSMRDFHQVIDFLSQSHISYALTKKPKITCYSSNNWRTAEASTDTDGEVFSNMRRVTKGYTWVDIGLFPTMLTLPTPESSHTPSSSPSRITSSPSLLSEPSTEPIFEPQPSPDAEYHVPSPNESPLMKIARIVLSEDEEDDSSKQGRIDEDLNTYFAQDDEVVHDQDTTKERQPKDSTAGITVSTAPINNSTARETHSTAGRVVYGRRSKEARKDKKETIMTEPEPEKKSKKLLEQERLGLEEAIRLQKQVDEEEKAQIARDEEIARQLLALDEERVTTETKTTKDIDWNDPSVQKQDVWSYTGWRSKKYSTLKTRRYDLMLWGDLDTLFELDEESEIWMNQNEYNLISWSLCDFCGVHILLMQNGIRHPQLTEKKYPLIKKMIIKDLIEIGG
ncbi:hypothetical protein Tco_0999371 [Tanacetum coccineum]